ncbi:MAG TPA: hypothetical protein VN618_03325 [Solirubrobacteraceae bacterium]|nr:hypothetical protein [Solirubrobacteraceae bacterium]
MTAHWEYLTIAWQSMTNYATKTPDEAQTWESNYRISKPNAEPEVLSATDVNWTTLLNELGADGWELVTESVRKTVIFSQSMGWSNVGSPIEIVWQFKRLAT